MKIGIDLDNYQSPIEEWDTLINNYGEEREIGYLKINPERIPVIVSERKALKEIEKWGDKVIRIRFKDFTFEMFLDYKGCLFSEPKDGGNVVVFGNAYIAKKQWEADTPLTMREIKELIDYIEIGAMPQADKPEDYFDVYGFEYDKELRCYR